MAVGGGGVEALFWKPPVTPGDVVSWYLPGVLMDGGAGGGGGGMSIGGAIVGGTPNTALFVGPTGVLAQTTVPTTSGQVMTCNGSTWVPTAGSTGQMTWVPYTTLGQSFLPQNMTRDGDWTMVANTATTDRPAPQPTGAEEDLLPAWTPNRQSAVGTLTHYNEWTVNTGGWIGQYGVDIIRQNVGDTHTITLTVNGSIRDTFTAVASTEGIYWHDIAPIVVASGAVIRTTMQISSTGSNSGFEQVGLFATAPVYCSLARGSLNGAAAGTTAYSCHLRFTPGTASPDWDIVAFAGAPGGGGGGGPEPVIAWSLEGNPTGSTTTPTAFTIGSLTAKTTPASTDQLLLQDNAASGALKSVPWSSLPSGGGGGGMSIGGAITGGTPGEALVVGAGPVLAQTTNLPVSVLNSGTAADAGTFWRGDGTWSNVLAPPYKPTALGTALRAWYEMDKLVGGAGSSQSAIPDQTTNAFNLSQATGSQQGTLAVADQNGLNTLRFTAANTQQYLMANAILSGAVAGSMYMVYKVVTPLSGTEGGLDWGSSGVNNQWPYVDTNFYIDFGSTTRFGFGPTTASLSGYII